MPSRRRFLQQTLAATAAFGVVPAWARSGAATSARRPIVVIGAGLAGLATAERLSAAGEEVLVLEARAVPGGRVRTWRTGFADGQIAEAGPTRIADVHRRCLALAGRLGLTLEPCEATSGEAILVHRGCRIGASEACDRADPGLALHADERGLTAGELLERYTGRFAALLADPDSAAAMAAFWPDIDRLSWPDWLASRGASSAAVGLMTLGGDTRELSALYVLRQIALHRGARRYYRIAGGMDGLPAALAAQLGARVRHGVRVTRIEHAADGVRLHAVWDTPQFDGAVWDTPEMPVAVRDTHRSAPDIRDTPKPRAVLQDTPEFAPGSQRTLVIDARAVVVTAPPRTLHSVAFHPAMPVARARACGEITAYPATRYALQTRDRAWLEAGLRGAARTDGGAEIADASFGQVGPSGLLHVTARDPDRARGQGADIVQAGLAQTVDAFPGVAEHFERGAAMRWTSDPLAGGAFAAFRPGQLCDAGARLGQPFGRVHFAGEHTSPWTGWMEGALESAERVCRALLA